MMILFLLVSLITSQLFCAAEYPPQKWGKIISTGGFLPAAKDGAIEVPARFISYTCDDKKEIIFDTQFLEPTFKHSQSFQNRYSRNKNFEYLITSLCQGLKEDQIEFLIAAIGKNNEAIQGRVDSANVFAQRVQEKDFVWLLKKTRNYGIDYVHSALITRIATDPTFAYSISNNSQLTESTYCAISTRIDREKLHEIISGDLREIVKLNRYNGMIKSVFFDKQDPTKMFFAGSSGTVLYDVSKREIVQEFVLKTANEDSFVCRNRAGNYCFELNQGQVFLWELQFVPARKSELKLEGGIIKIGLNSSDTQFFAQYVDKLLLYDIATAESKEVSFSEGFDFSKPHENGYSVCYKDDDTLRIEQNGNLCMYDPKTGENRIVKLPADFHKDSPEIIYNEQGTQVLLRFPDKLLIYDFEKEREVYIRLPLKQSESLVSAQYCDNDSKLLLHTGYRIHVYDLQTRSCIASYPIMPQYNKLIYRPKTLIAVDGSNGTFVLYPHITLGDLDPKQILLLFKASACWHIDRKYRLAKDDYEVFHSLPEQIKSNYLFSFE
jgi:hypothetical protein